HAPASFRRYFMLDRREPQKLPLLRERLREVMVRTTRREAALELPPRRVRVERLAPNEAEAHLLAQALAAAREAAAALPQGKGRLALVTLLKQAASSPASLAQSLRSEEHTSELQSRENLVCRLLLE